MAQQTVVQVASYGGSPYSGIKVVQAPVPTPGQGEVLVRMSIRPINPADVFSVMGVYPGFTPKSLPAVPGLEGTGRIESFGPGAGTSGRLSVGQRVVAVAWPSQVGNGTWQQYVCVEEEVLVPVPEAISDEAAAQALVNPVPVIAMLQELAPPKGEYVIITAAGSALGRMALSYAKSLGVKTIATVRRKEQAEEIKAAGADEVVVVPGEDLGARAMAITGGKGAWGAMDCVAGDMPLQVAAGLRRDASLFVYGAMSGVDIKWNAEQGLFRGVALRGFWLTPWLHHQTAEEQRAILERVLGLMQQGVIPHSKGTVLPLEQVVEGLKMQEHVGRVDKVLLQG